MILRGYSWLSIVLLLFMLSRSWIESVTTAFVRSTPTIYPTGLDPESVIARGGRISLENIDLYSAQLISGVGADLSQRIVEKKLEIRMRAQQLPCAIRYRSLEIVKGIGEKTSKQLKEYIDTGDNPSCVEPAADVERTINRDKKNRHGDGEKVTRAKRNRGQRSAKP